jgi:lipopolysaccharide transport system permease protein
MIPWQLFANAISETSSSLIGNANLIAKIYFPRLIIPVAAVLVTIIDFLISFLLLVGLMAIFHTWPDWRALTVPLFLLLALFLALGCGLWFSALNVRYRDFRYIIPFVVQFGLFISPVGFSSIVIPAKWRLIYSLNPMVGVIDGFRWGLLRGQIHLYWPGLALALLLSSLVFFSGLLYFRRVERSFADFI